MQAVQDTNLQRQIDEALKRAKPKKAIYFYDESGYKKLIGVFEKKKAAEVKKYYRDRNLINRLTEAEIITTEPDSTFG
jgi:hypothetical protein